jgi:GNAT superfamily N-acetyltransferase
MAFIRPYRDTDLRAVYDVCVRTADAGGDARGKYHSDDLMPDLFAGPPGNPGAPAPPASPDDEMIALHYRPERLLWAGLDAYPAHLHIDLLPPFQGAGHGRALMETFYAAAARAGAPGVHLTVLAANTRAIGFYRHLGLRRLDPAEPGESHVVYLGREL